MKQHSNWFKRTINPILRRIFRVEITTIVSEEKVIGYGIRKQL